MIDLFPGTQAASHEQSGFLFAGNLPKASAESSHLLSSLPGRAELYRYFIPAAEGSFD